MRQNFFGTDLVEKGVKRDITGPATIQMPALKQTRTDIFKHVETTMKVHINVHFTCNNVPVLKVFQCLNIGVHFTFLFEKAKCVGVKEVGKDTVVKLAVAVDVHCSAQAMIQGDVSTKTSEPLEAEVMVVPPETCTSETATAGPSTIATTSEKGAQPKVQVQ